MLRYCALLALLFSSVTLSAPQRDWQLVKSEQDITLHSRKHSDGLIEIRAQMFTPTSYSAFINLLEDTQHVPNWIKSVTGIRVLTQISPTENKVHTIFNAPWPAKDRDMVTNSRYFFDQGAFKLHISDASNTLPTQDGYIRITKVSGEWTLQQLSNGTTHIEYLAFADPGGALPKWLVNKLSIDSVFNTFIGLRRELAKYQDQVNPHVVKLAREQGLMQ
ncbi:START domain-containing protein [Motilimonas cestriensis]|uniref:START domain-containing protein n=1 Tax=Motilimonas cestriensis TaxID=2742685 RepID=A0ABS8WD03_9GAMM|nr:START domain-containing protein [Motilimonas cestriensis]MCE2596926.1 START domain-containing protein [Motilimonas cestriensis]